jgi:drug/metabolite transporter (DMT)-like permease
MAATQEKNAQGILLMSLSMAAFAFADTLIKLATGIIAPAQVLFLLVTGGLIVFTVIAKLQGQTLRDRRAFLPALLLRYIAEICGMFGTVLALAYVPLSTVGAMIQATPLLVVLGAVLFLGEKVSWRRWSAIIIGFVGVILIIQPGGQDFDWTIGWAVLSLVGLSIRDLATRLAPANMPSACMAIYTMVAAIPFAATWVLLSGESLIPSQANWFMVVAMIGLGSFGYILLITSIRMADISIVQPFRYLRLIFLLIFGVVIFGERPSLSILVGAALIILSGLYTIMRERRVRQMASDRTG